MKNNSAVKKTIDQLEAKIGYVFTNKQYINEALTHSSFANEQKINKRNDYERLEFLGDAVLELISSEFLYHRKPFLPEGKMTQLRASAVCEPTLAYCAEEIGLSCYILLGKGEEISGGRKRPSIISDVMEAVIGAIYLDGGLDPARQFIHRFILSDMEERILFHDSKSMLQEMVQTTPGRTLEYRLIKEEGPDHDKYFEVEVIIDGKTAGSGHGKSKKSAEQGAAYEALKHLQNSEQDGRKCI